MTSREHQGLVAGQSPFVWLELAQPGSPSPGFCAHLPHADGSSMWPPFCPHGSGQAKGPPDNPPPRKRKQSQAWCFKPLLREGRSGIYVHKRREVVHVQKEVGPCVPLQGLRRNWQETEKIVS